MYEQPKQESNDECQERLKQLLFFFALLDNLFVAI